ncbi:unnamed protein product [Malassezia sympodialis ATCC 42132]|uniref:Sorting nexin-4 n=1 Tax=Malassezia sympodialis (strain ATCC 42132) TaxID=1230383 RepID=M5E852_MALS4|nr:uncharacterized protein MSY001_1460 [Malassezia sympodialis ATCC 42132]CCU98754.1 unnamed protein product [Malassezia sympodialis ATCC 42132]SHO77447.1 Similar to S.cerevisiae protein SNX4 (Sorting nexin) [Malassezia sympodialis ATCC 42132]|eukprot:XP_018740039.1 uncharacterized protein MSY001_1460 [Malassezia sympodialis ATCC 42132]
MATDEESSLWLGELRVQIFDPRKESPSTSSGDASDTPSTAGRSQTFVSYGVRAETSLPHFSRSYMVTRKRFQDFVFLRNALVKDFPACTIPPLPDKHRIGYLTGDRFSPEFIQRRSMELQLFLERVCRHPTLQRAKIVQQFLESSEWHIDMHSYSGQSMGVSAGPHVQALPPPAHHGLLESMGDVFINAFARVRRPDPKFVAVRSELEEQEDRNLQLERVLLRNRTHVSDLSTDYHDMGHAFEQLAVLESGMAGGLQRVGAAMKSMAELETRFTSQVTDDLLTLVHAKQAFMQSHKALLKQRDAKQLDFEGLTDYLHTAVTERERLTGLSDAEGISEPGAVRGTGLRGYVRSTMDRMWGVDEEQARIERLQRLDGRISELQEAVQTAHTHAQAFNEHAELEHRVFELGRQHEDHQMLRLYVEGQVALQEQGLALWDELLKSLETPSHATDSDRSVEPAPPTSASV